MPGCIVSATTASFISVEKRRRRATQVITSTFENVSDIGVCLGLSLGPPAKAGVRSKQGAVHRCTYIYDFGDCWEHQLTLANPRPAEPGLNYPRYLGGERAAPPEDCGGIPGF